MFADYRFNGYEITTDTGHTYPAGALNFKDHIPEGTFTIVDPKGAPMACGEIA